MAKYYEVDKKLFKAVCQYVFSLTPHLEIDDEGNIRKYYRITAKSSDLSAIANAAEKIGYLVENNGYTLRHPEAIFRPDEEEREMLKSLSDDYDELWLKMIETLAWQPFPEEEA